MKTISDIKVRRIIRSAILKEKGPPGRSPGPIPQDMIQRAKELNSLLDKNNIEGKIPDGGREFSQFQKMQLEKEISRAEALLARRGIKSSQGSSGGEKARRKEDDPDSLKGGDEKTSQGSVGQSGTTGSAQGTSSTTGTQGAGKKEDEGRDGEPVDHSVTKVQDKKDKDPKSSSEKSKASKGTSVDTGVKDVVFSIDSPLGESPNKGTMHYILRETPKLIEYGRKRQIQRIKSGNFAKSLAKEVQSRIPTFDENSFMPGKDSRWVIDEIAKKIENVVVYWQKGALERAVKQNRTLDNLWNDGSREIADTLTEPETVGGAVAGGGIGMFLGGPVGAAVGFFVGGAGGAAYDESKKQVSKSGVASDAAIIRIMLMQKDPKNAIKFHFHKSGGPGAYSVPANYGIPNVMDTGPNGVIIFNILEYLRRISTSKIWTIGGKGSGGGEGAEDVQRFGMTVQEYKTQIEGTSDHEFTHQVGYATMTVLMKNFGHVISKTDYSLNSQGLDILVDTRFIDDLKYAKKKIKKAGGNPDRAEYLQQYLGKATRGMGVQAGAGDDWADRAGIEQEIGTQGWAFNTGPLETRARLVALAELLGPNPSVDTLQQVMNMDYYDIIDLAEKKGVTTDVAQLKFILKPAEQMGKEELSAVLGVLGEGVRIRNLVKLLV